MTTTSGLDQEASANSEIQRINQQLDELLPLDQITVKEPEEPTILYELLDEVPNGRKLLNHMFHTASGLPLSEQEMCNAHLHIAASEIADRWYEEERRASTQALPAALQLDAPVIFSWSKKAAGTKTSPQKNTPDNSIRETTNQALFKSISSRLSELVKQRDTLEDGLEERDGSRRADMSPSKQRWAKSEFHVDPLQQFVATALPKPSKKETSEKKKVKRRSILNFWGSSHRKKEERKSPEDNPVRTSTEQPEASQMSSLKEEPTSIEQNLPKQENPAPSPDSTMTLNSFIPLQPKKK